mmetsp:Transcript_22800/g.33387  ORF Transcript_22800/g.33387 Transcript_22800/m.33387 type:complete len:192 (-) Transcript_22800:305-880(-)|eukprot:CAMPEP_0197242240 /NCGR_PEP_ID=MMETSP1429-20130617/8046_1 /TAXON_ID=49237 /ORGANISM="Chaetoceros  sp., Strain UNC1202" /LENGTH=191 /DNA_ID=CAMNT_0042702229 /DNA_START=116 /DNA_END=691 /DNA_ORIENTATION=+
MMRLLTVHAVLLLFITCPHASAFFSSTIGRYPAPFSLSPSVKLSRNDASSSTKLFSTPPKRIARRDLKKRSRRKRDGKSKTATINNSDSTNNPRQVTIETRPLVRSKSIEAGEDYWIDEEDLKKSLEREDAIRNRKAMEGEISQEKLRTEVVAPYKQNWIGLFSVGIVVLATIVTQFPELLNAPVIPFPDL